MKVEDLPRSIRLKLSAQSEERLWERIEKIGVREFAAGSKFSETDLYNWRSKDVFLPSSLVSEVLDEPEVEAFKGGGRSRPVRNPEFPLTENPELLTRVQESVSVNREGVPVYRTRERSLLERFRELLGEMGEVPVSVYSRSGYELRYPKHLHDIFEKMEFEEDFAARVDESGNIEEGFLEAGDTKIPFDEFDGELHSREKSFQLAVARNNSEEVERIIAEESGRIREIFG